MTQTAALDKAFKLFNEKKLDEANDAFQAILNDKDTPIPVRATVTRYAAIIANKKQAGQETVEPSQLSVAYFLNKNDISKAKELLQAGDFAPGLKHFLTAEIAVAEGDHDAAVESLEQAIEADETNRGYAINSPTFSPLLQDEKFAFLQVEE